MPTISPLITNSQYGLPKAHEKLQNESEGHTASLAQDVFSHVTIELPKGSDNYVMRKGDWAAVISLDLINKKLQRVALWSLITCHKAWEIEFSQFRIACPHSALSKSGLVLLSPEYNAASLSLLVCDGKMTELPRPNRELFSLSGNKVFSCYSHMTLSFASPQFLKKSITQLATVPQEENSQI